MTINQKILFKFLQPAEDEVITPQMEQQDVLPQEIIPQIDPQIQDQLDIPEEEQYVQEDESQPMLKSGFIPPEKKRGETKQQYSFRTKYYEDKFFDRPTSKHSNNKYKTEYKKYLKDLKL